MSLEDELLAQRLQRAAEIEALGFRAYGHRFDATHTLGELAGQFDALSGDELAAAPSSVRVAGRLMTVRRMGKAGFAHLQQNGARMQIYVRKDAIPENDWKLWELADLGDIVGCDGTMFRTRTGELSIHVAKLYFLSKTLLDFSCELLRQVAIDATGGTLVDYDGVRLDFGNIRRLSMRQAVVEFWKGDGRPTLDQVADPEWLARNSVKETPGERLADLFERVAENQLIQPTIVYQYPVETSPLSKNSVDNPAFTDRFEIYAAGMEIGNAYTELNDPQEQRRRFEMQRGMVERGDQEAHRMDEDYLRAMCYGLPPTGGEGIGIDRLTMILTGRKSILDVILFPLLRPEGEIGLAVKLRSLEHR